MPMKREKLVLLFSSLTLNVTEEEEEEKGISLFFVDKRRNYPFSSLTDERYEKVASLPERY